MVQMYHKTPSELMKINDDYLAYCLDEAIAEFIINLEKGKKPRFRTERRSRDKGDNPGLKMLLG